MGDESEIFNEFKKIFKESKVHSTLRNISQKLEDIKGFDKNLINSLKSYVQKSEDLKRMALTPGVILFKCKDLETKYKLFKLPFKDNLIEAIKTFDNMTNTNYAKQFTDDLNRIEKVFEPVPDLVKQLQKIYGPENAAALKADKLDPTNPLLKDHLEAQFSETIATIFSRKDYWYVNYKDFVESSFDPDDDKHTYYRLKSDDQKNLVAEAKAIHGIYKSASKSTDVPTLLKIMKHLKDKLNEFKTKLEKAWKASKKISTSQAQKKDDTADFLNDYTANFLLAIKFYDCELSRQISKLDKVYKLYGPD